MLVVIELQLLDIGKFEPPLIPNGMKAPPHPEWDEGWNVCQDAEPCVKRGKVQIVCILTFTVQIV